MVQQAQSELRKMSPAEIEARVKSLGMTMDEAKAKAQMYGIDLETYLQRGGTSRGLPVVDTLLNVQPQFAVPSGIDTSAVSKRQRTGSPAPQIKKISPVVGPHALTYFGYDVFQNIPAAFEPTASGPVDPDYLIGPSDVLLISVWGQVELRNEFQVDKDGRIFIPNVGPILISGQTLQEAQKTILKSMSRSYAGLNAKAPTAWLDVTITRLRPKRVFIMGEVLAPGGYTVSSYATVFNCLYSIGGPTVKGSLRDVRLLRNGKIIAHVDFYSYLTGSDKINDVRIQDNDIIFVPTRGKTVSIQGEVRRPAMYELLPDENLRKLLDFAGGPLPTTYLERVQVEHIIPFKQRTQRENDREIQDIGFRAILNSGKDYTLADGDAVTLYPILYPAVNYVTIQGDVYRPGTYQLEKVRTLRDLILAADSLRNDVYLKRADITRTLPDSSLVMINVNLEQVMAGDTSQNVVLKALDAIRVYSKWEMVPHRTVSIRGHVLFPATYPYADSLTLFDLVFKAGGLQDSIFRAATFLPRADLIRLNPDGITKRTIPFDLGALLDTLPGSNMKLEPEDEVVVQSIDLAVIRDDTVEVLGKVKNPGKFRLTTNMTLRDAIYLAGGYTEDAATLEAEIARIQPKGMGEDSLVYIRFARLPDFAETLARRQPGPEAERAAGFRLTRHDIVFVRPNPEFKLQQLVTLGGELRHSGVYALQYPNERLSSLIKRAGGGEEGGFLTGRKNDARRGESQCRFPESCP
jgi:polysaccharide export outer membrane protein